ncbi:hypothetical protein ACFLU5_10420 [Bacteroidota bacterium]
MKIKIETQPNIPLKVWIGGDVTYQGMYPLVEDGERFIPYSEQDFW